ncbi:flagellar biosynthesis anti-sigma factor FlgM [Roseateles paludis]|jgi:negative regulator of flagellin synthesis FlgM|uniref:Negative regulator of flagellin synthesis n=1 Tax=Roseateles paludis TaxID=3145238 RepID=A0ABV0G0D2_9BURK
MKVGHHLEAPAAKLERPAARKPEASTSAPATQATSAPQVAKHQPAHEASAQVEISSAAAQLVKSHESSFDAAKVQRISQQIAEGTFKPDANGIADKLISNAQELLARSKQRAGTQ